MKEKFYHDNITLLDISDNKQHVGQIILDFFQKLHFGVQLYLKEINDYVIILAEFPVDRSKLLDILDPYRKYCDSVLLMVIDETDRHKDHQLNDLKRYGISDVVFIKHNDHITSHLNHHFNHWRSINMLNNRNFLKKTERINYPLECALI